MPHGLDSDEVQHIEFDFGSGIDMFGESSVDAAAGSPSPLSMDTQDVVIQETPSSPSRRASSRKEKKRISSSRWVLEEISTDFWDELYRAKAAGVMDSARLAKVIEETAPKPDYEVGKKERTEQDKHQREYIFEMMKFFGMPEAMAGRILETDANGSYIMPFKYLPVRMLSSQGAMGKVFEARDLNVPGRELVMKAVYDARNGLDERAFDRFRQEALSLAAIRNEHVLAIKSADFMPDKSGGWYVMDKLQGGDVETLLERGSMSVEEALDMFEQVADGLAAAHHKGIAHRDIKPANIFIQREKDINGKELPPVYKVGDFGLAKPVEQERDKLEWIKQQAISIAEGERSVADFEKYDLDAHVLETLKELSEQVQKLDLTNRIKGPDWRKELSRDQDAKAVLAEMQQLVALLPGAGVEYTYDVLLNRFESDKWEWITTELARLANQGDVDETDVHVPEQFVIRKYERAALAALANARHNDPEAGDDHESLADIAHKIELKPSITSAGSILGTPVYMSPEQISGVFTDTKSDVFALGSVIYEAISGTRPFEAETMVGVLTKITSTDPDMLNEIRPDVPQRLSDLVAAMMEKDPEFRLSMDDVRQELRQIREEQRQGKQKQQVSTVRGLLSKLFSGS